MIQLRPIDESDLPLFKDSEYSAASPDQQRAMIAESRARLHEGRYFEFFVALYHGRPVGFMSLYAHSPHIISCAPEIFPSDRRKGLAFIAEQAALEHARRLGYTVAVANVREENLASRALHEKLGFEHERSYPGRNGALMRLYIRAL